MTKTKDSLILELTHAGIPTGKKIVVTGGIYENDNNDKKEIVAMEIVTHNSTSQNQLISFLKNDKYKVFEKHVFSEQWGTGTEKEFVGTTSLLEKVQEKELVYPKGFKKQLWLHSFAGDKSVSIETLYFLIPINSDKDDKEYLKEGLKNKALKKMPIPIKEDWFDYLWEEVEELFVPLVTFGNFGYKGYLLKLSVEKLQKAVTNIQAKMEWKQHFKRVPKFKPLLQIMTIQGFNFKEWQKFFKNYVDVIKEFPEDVQEDIIRAWELLGNEKAEWIVKNKDFIHGISWKVPQVTIRLERDKNKKQQIKKFFKEGFEHFYNLAYKTGQDEKNFQKNSNLFYKFINLFEDLVKNQFQNLKNKNWNAIIKFLENFTYREIEEGCEELAKECARCGVPEVNFRTYEEWWLDNIDNINTSPREYPTISGKVGKYTWKMSDMSDPKAWVAGLDTYCCQHFHNVGGACVEYAILNPEKSGIFMVQDKTTKAQSFTWLSEFKKDINGKEHRILVFDNIEVAGNELRNGIVEAYKDFLSKLEKYAAFFRIKAVVVGEEHSDVDIVSAFDGKRIDKKHKYYAPIPNSLEYTDAKRQVLVKVYDW